MSKSITPVTFVCDTCGSDHVRRDAEVCWNADTQQWVVASVLDSAHCRRCGDECSLRERALQSVDHVLCSVETFLEGFEGDSEQEGITEMLEQARAVRRRAASIEGAARDVVQGWDSPEITKAIADLESALARNDAPLYGVDPVLSYVESFLEGFKDDPKQEGISEMMTQLMVIRLRVAAIEDASWALVRGWESQRGGGAVQDLASALSL